MTTLTTDNLTLDEQIAFADEELVAAGLAVEMFKEFYGNALAVLEDRRNRVQALRQQAIELEKLEAR